MDSVTPRALERVQSLLRSLGQRPFVLLAVLVGLNSLVFPYGGFRHDARLYGVQVLNRLENGAFGGDLFLRYGSQDQFSVFSRLVAPLAGLCGLTACFFLLYLVCNSVLIVAMKRLVETLIDDLALSTLVLIVLMVTPLDFGGFRIFHVQEPFLTPRILANACVLLGLERMLKRRYATALLLMALGGAFHPIMTVGGVAVLAVWVCWRYLPRKGFAVLVCLTCVFALLVVIWAPLGSLLFGQMDDEWLRQVHVATPYNFPLEWESFDWIRLFLCLGTAALAAYCLRNTHPEAAQLAAIAAIVGLGGLAATLFAGQRGYTLLFQGQPYRALWLARFLQPILAALLAKQLWLQGTEPLRLLALAVVSFIGVRTLLPIELSFPLFFLPITILAYRGIQSAPRAADWLSRSVAASLILGTLAWSSFLFWLNMHFRDQVLEQATSWQFAVSLTDCFGPVAWTLLALAVLLALERQFGVGTRLAVAGAGLALASQTIFFVLPSLPFFRQQAERYYPDECFVAGFLATRSTPDKARPTVYWSIGSIEALWFDLGVQSYYERLQIQGVLFNRQTAIEGRKRALLVRQFEMERLEQEKLFLTDTWRPLLETLYDMPFDTAQPEQADLERLCLDPACDYVILKQGFEGLYSASNGRFYIYECDRVRTQLAARGPARTAPRHSVVAANSMTLTSERKE